MGSDRHGAAEAERLDVTNRAPQQAAFVNDEFGNAKGGIRHTYVDVPDGEVYFEYAGIRLRNLASKVTSIGIVWNQSTVLEKLRRQGDYVQLIAW